MECEPFSQVHNLRIDVDIVEDVCNEAITLAEFGFIVEEIATLLQRKPEIADYFC
jgi:hypothetical protein